MGPKAVDGEMDLAAGVAAAAMEGDDAVRWKPPGVVWSHATNSQALLADALESGAHFIEADVLMSAASVPIMAHPPALESDLTLASFLQITAEHNKAQPWSSCVALKLDFKDPAAVGPSLDLLESSAYWGAAPESGTPPVWLNADVLPGPGSRPPKFNAARFVKQCLSRRPQATLSLGWTVSTSAAATITDGYTDVHIDDMVTLCRENTIGSVTFAVHSLYAQQAAPQMLRLLSEVPRSSLTCWGLADDGVHGWLETLDSKRIYVDTLEPTTLQWVFLRMARLLRLLK